MAFTAPWYSWSDKDTCVEGMMHCMIALIKVPVVVAVEALFSSVVKGSSISDS
jgi:hypothetical protein